jgi:peptidoglycan/LPS O-acetylase OafA/YrhL
MLPSRIELVAQGKGDVAIVLSSAERALAASKTAVPRSTKRIAELDGVRGLAIALVLIYHYVDVVVPAGARTIYGSGTLFYAFLPTRLMWAGVDLFFVLSGFLIGGILIDHRESPRYYEAFYARRIHRIFPIYYLMIAFVAFGTWAWSQSPLFRGDMPVWVFLLYAQNLTGDYTASPDALEVTWSLAVEEQFYLLFPFIVRFCSPRAVRYVLAACIVGAPLFRALMIGGGFGFEQVYPLLPSRADTLALGVVAAIIVRSESATSWVVQHSHALYAGLLGLCLLLPTMLKWTAYTYVGTLGYSIIAVTCFLFVLLLLLAPIPGMKAALSARWLAWLGTVSYCVYLVHQPMKLWLFSVFLPGADPFIEGPRSILVTALALIATLGLAQVSWVVIERPLVRRGHVRYRY